MSKRFKNPYFQSELNRRTFSIGQICKHELNKEIEKAEKAFLATALTLSKIQFWSDLAARYQFEITSSTSKFDTDMLYTKIGIIYLLMAQININQNNSADIFHQNFSDAASFFRLAGDRERADNVKLRAKEYRVVFSAL